MTKLLLVGMIGSATTLIPGLAHAQFVQDSADYLAADTVDMVFSVKPDAAGDNRKLQADLYVFNDGNDIGGATMGFSWDNPNLHMDSAFLSPEATSAFSFYSFVFDRNQLDSTNANQRFLFAGFLQSLPAMAAFPARRLWASYYFTLTNWSETDSIVIDTLMWGGGTVFKIGGIPPGGGVFSYRPYWTGRKVVLDSPPSCCVLRVGDANCAGGDEPTIADVAVLIDYLFISGILPCCIPEADVNQSGGPDPTAQDITISDVSLLQDYLFITGPSLGLADCF